MDIAVDADTRRAARVPHELAMVNLVVFNLLLCAGILAGSLARKGSLLAEHRAWLVVVPLCLSLATIAACHARAAAWRARITDPANGFVAAHWQIAVRRYRVLLIAYAAAALLVGIGWLLSLANPALHEVMFVAFVRVAVAPLLITVMVLAVLESSALFQAVSGEVPRK